MEDQQRGFYREVCYCSGMSLYIMQQLYVPPNADA